MDGQQEISRLTAEVARLMEHSRTLNTVSYRIALIAKRVARPDLDIVSSVHDDLNAVEARLALAESMKVEITTIYDDVATCRVCRDGIIVFDGLSRGAFLSGRQADLRRYERTS